ncbi:sigma-70 family RNA polymerase sigma factor [Pigmentiphaga soli]|uniref:Sigma-70 family RNA polymerase sigma factor n=1 Tax=Pigmentiphaga soli TaxID=1007095 RepID=A0ABP8GFM2_9BURK
MALGREYESRQAVGLLYGEHHGWLQGWLHRRLGCRADVADLSHDVFERVLVSPHAAQLAEPRAFLTTLAKRVLFTFWRRRDLENAYLDALARLPEAASPSAEDLALAQEAIAELDRMLDGLPAAVKRVFLLNRLDGLTHVQIARETGVSVATVERYMKQALLHCWCLRRDPE